MHESDHLRQIDEFPGYFISKDGGIFSNKRGRIKEMRGNINGRGYRIFNFIRNGEKFYRRHHRIIADVFCGPRTTERPMARHLNDNPSDNRICNIAWGSASENYFDAKRNNRIKPRFGQLSGTAKLTENDVLDIRSKLTLGALGSDLAEAFSVSRATITHIKQKRSWRHI